MKRGVVVSIWGLIFVLGGCSSSNDGSGSPTGGDPAAQGGNGGGGSAGGGGGGPGTSGGPALPPGQVVGHANGRQICGGTLARTTFRFGLCLCEDVAFASVLETTGSVGANGLFRSDGYSNVGGSLFAGRDARPVGKHDIKGELHVGGDVTAAGDIHVFKDAYVRGNLLGIVTKIDGTLHIPASSSTGLAAKARRVVREPVSVEPPCDCNPAGRINIAGFVGEAARQNDNAAIGLAAGAWAGLLVPIDVRLPPGRYYLDSIGAVAPVRIHITRPTALFIGRDLKSASIFEIVLDDPAAEMDIFIAGDILASGAFQLGTKSRPSKVRTYVAGSRDIVLLGDLTFGGNLYAPNARIVAAGPLNFQGSILARQLIEAGVVKIGYDKDVLLPGSTCNPPQMTTPPMNPPGGGHPPMNPPMNPPTDGDKCTSCIDCGNQACTNGVCGACRASSDCCSPLTCDSGRCVPPIY